MMSNDDIAKTSEPTDDEAAMLKETEEGEERPDLTAVRSRSCGNLGVTTELHSPCIIELFLRICRAANGVKCENWC